MVELVSEEIETNFETDQDSFCSHTSDIYRVKFTESSNIFLKRFLEDTWPFRGTTDVPVLLINFNFIN